MIIDNKKGIVYTGDDKDIGVTRFNMSSLFDTLEEDYEVIRKDISDNKDDIEKLNKEIEILENNIVGLLDIDLNTIQYMHEIEERTSDLADKQRKIKKDIYNIDLKLKALKSYTENISTEEWFLEMKRSARRYYFENLFSNYQYQIYAILAVLAIGVMIFLTFIF